MRTFICDLTRAQLSAAGVCCDVAFCREDLVPRVERKDAIRLDAAFLLGEC